MNVGCVGGAGFIGSAFVRKMITLGADVTVYDNFSRGTPKNLPDSVKLVKADAKEGGLNLRGMDWVVDFAARVAGARDLYNDPAPLLSDNIRITDSSLRAVVDCEVPNYFFVSSSCVYDFPGAKVPHVEDDTQICDTSYGFSKVVGEQMTNWYAKQFGFSARIVRLFNVYGQNDSPLFSHVIPDFFLKAEAIKKGEATTFPILGDGSQTRDFTWMDDVIEGLVMVMMSGEHLQPYNIGTGVETSVRRLAELVCEIVGVPIPAFPSELVAKEDIQRRAADASRLRSLGWRPETDLRAGLQRMYEARTKITA